jgi:hypothetical protein
LSFYYQPQGYGNAPEKDDSLVLQISTKTGIWKNIWAAPGTSYDEFLTDSLQLSSTSPDLMAFKYVAIQLPIHRFLNQISGSGSIIMQAWQVQVPLRQR